MLSTANMILRNIKWYAIGCLLICIGMHGSECQPSVSVMVFFFLVLNVSVLQEVKDHFSYWELHTSSS